jgi:hypothetical protein
MVMIARPVDANPLLEETTFRLRAELAAAGYGSEVATCAVDPASGRAGCPRDQALATIALARANGATTIFVTSKLRSGVELRRQVRVQAEDGGGDATLLAVRAVELLRDLQLEVAQVSDDDEDPTPLEPFNGGAGSTGSRWYLWGGGALLLVPWTTSRSFDVAPGAVVGLGMRLGEHVMLVLDAAGPFAGSLAVGAVNASGSITDRPIYGAVGKLAVRLGAQSPVQGFFAKFSVGLMYTYAELDPSLSYGSAGTAVAPMGGFGPGYTIRLTPRLFVSTDFEVVWTSNVRIEAVDSSLLASSGNVRMFFNVTAGFGLP